MEGAEAARIKRGDCCKVQEMSPNCRLAVGRLRKWHKQRRTTGTGGPVQVTIASKATFSFGFSLAGI